MSRDGANPDLVHACGEEAAGLGEVGYSAGFVFDLSLERLGEAAAMASTTGGGGGGHISGGGGFFLTCLIPRSVLDGHWRSIVEITLAMRTVLE